MSQTGRKKKGVQDGSATGQPKAKLEQLRPAGAKGEEKTASRRGSKYQKVLDTASNIAQHKNVEDELMREHNLLRTLIDSMPDEIYVKDTGSRFVLYNRAVARHRGAADAESLLGKTDFDLYPREEAEQCCAREQEIIRSGKGITNFLQKGFDQTGNEIIGLTTKAPLRDSKGEIVGVIGISRNVTEEKKAEKALMDERNLLRTLIDNLPDQIYVKDTAGHFLLCNEAVARQVGKTIDQVIGKTDFDLFDSKLAKVYAEEEAQVVRTGKPMINKETFGTDICGRSGWALATKVPLKNSTGQVVGIVGINREITEIKQAQAEIQKLARFPSENPYPVLRVHKDGTVLYANKASEELLKARGSKVGGAAPAEWHRLVEEVLASGRVAREEMEHQGRVFVFRVTPVAESDYVNFYGADITEQKQAEEEREVTIKLLRLINSDNGMHELMKLVSVFLRDWSGCEAVGVRLQEGEDFPYFVTSGFPEEFVLAESKLCSVNEIGEVVRDSRGRAFLECMCGNIISGRFDPSKPFFTGQGSFWTNSTTDLLAGTNECDRMAKTRNRCNTAGYESVALVRLRAGKETFGLLQFNSKERNRFTADKISLFERLADNLAIGLAQRRAEEALAESEKRFRTLADESFDSIVIHDGGVVVEANKGFCDKWGYEKSEAAGLRVEDLIAKELLAVVRANIRRGWGKPYEALAKRKDGTTFPVEILGKSITYKERTVRIATARDITERKRAEEKLREAFAWQETIFEGSRDAILITDEDSRFVTVNKAACELTGYSREELLKMRIPDLHAEQDLTAYRLYHGRIMAGEQILTEAKILRKDGSKVDTEFNNRCIEIAGTRYMHTSARDVTDRKRGEQTLRESQELLSLYIRHSPIYTYIKTVTPTESRVLQASDNYQQMIGIPGWDMVGKTMAELFPAEFAAKITADDWAVVANSEVLILDEELNGRSYTTIKFPIVQGDKTVLAGYTIDITERKRAEEALKKSNQLLRDTGEMAKVGGWELDLSTREVFCTEETCRIHGVEPGYKPKLEEALNFYAPESRPGLEAVLKKAAETGEPYDIESLFIPSGSKDKIWVRSLGRAVYSGDKIVKLTGTFQNIDKYKRADEEYKTILHTAMDGFTIDDIQGRILDVNDAYCRMVGYTRDELLTMRISDVEAVEREGETAQRIKKIMEVGGDRFETRHRCKDGRIVDVEISVGYIDAGGGRLFVFARDITERKHAERALQTSEERFRSLFEQAADAIVVIDARTGEMAEFNEKAHQMLGYTRTEYAKLRLSDIEAIESKKEVAAHIDKVVRQGSDIFEAKQRKKDGTLCDVLVSSKLITVAGKPYLQAIWRDITELKKAEGKLLEYQKQLKSLAFQLAIAEERERRRIAGQLHDQVSQSLALAKIKVDSLRASVDAGQIQNVLGEIAESIEKVVADTRSLTFDISYPLLYELGFEAAVAEWLREEIGEKHKIETGFEDDGQPKPLDDDVRALLFRNVRELLANVVKHARASSIKVAVHRVGDNIQVTVHDNGVGFDLTEVRSLTGKRRAFGLFSVRERLEHLGGRVETDSAPGRGCRITMTAPLKPGDSAGRETQDDHKDTTG